MARKNLDWIYLSYPLSDKITAYGNGKRIRVDKVKSIAAKDSCNGTHISVPTHFGTHIDFPYHFGNEGKTGDAYKASDFISNLVGHLRVYPRSDIIRPSDISVDKVSKDIDFIFIDTGFWKKRNQDVYWNNNPGIHAECAPFLKQHFPALRLLGIDSISINPWNNKKVGREAHRSFLLKHDIMLVEDIDYSGLYPQAIIKQVIVSPLRFAGADGAPATIFAGVEHG